MGTSTSSIEMSRNLSLALSSSKLVITAIDMHLRMLFLRAEGPPKLAIHADSHTFIQASSGPLHRRALHHPAAPCGRFRCHGRCIHRPWPHAEHHRRHVCQRHDDRLVAHQNVETKPPNDDNHANNHTDDHRANNASDDPAREHGRRPGFSRCRSVGVLLWNREHHRPAQNGGNVPHHGH